MTIHFSRKEIPLQSVTISWSDVTKIFERLLKHVNEEADRAVGQLVKQEPQSDAEFEEFRKDIRAKAFRVTVTIYGRGNESLYGDDIELFRSPNLPDNISSVYMTNGTAFEGVARVKPANRFELSLDFSKPPLLDGNNPVSSPTTNFSKLAVEGDRDSWVAVISDAVLGVVNNRKNLRAWIHRGFVYDIGLLLFGLPIGLYTCWQLSGLIEDELGSVNSFLSSVAYVYVILIATWAYRIFFGYTKWAFPTVELKEAKDAARGHRAFWYAILIGIVGQFIWTALF